MKKTIGRGGVSYEELQLLHDSELSGAAEQELRAQIEGDPQLRSELEQLEMMQRLVVASLEHSAREVPQARFEQIWEEVDRAIDRDARLQEAAERRASIWSRLRTMARPLRWPTAAAAAALAMFWLIGPDQGPNKPDAVASVEVAEPMRETRAPAPPKAVAAAPQVAVSDTAAAEDPFAEPKPVEAEIHEVEFGGRSGRIGQTGTVTVLYVEDNLQPTDNERSL